MRDPLPRDAPVFRTSRERGPVGGWTTAHFVSGTPLSAKRFKAACIRELNRLPVPIDPIEGKSMISPAGGPSGRANKQVQRASEEG